MIKNLTIEHLTTKAIAEEIHEAVDMLVERLNELNEISNQKIVLSRIEYMGQMPKKIKQED